MKSRRARVPRPFDGGINIGVRRPDYDDNYYTCEVGGGGGGVGTRPPSRVCTVDERAEE